MAWFQLAFRPEVIGDLGKIDAAIAQRLFDKTKWLASNVDNLRHEPVSPDLVALCKYAVGEWRIFYSVDRTDHIIDIHCIVHQKHVR